MNKPSKHEYMNREIKRSLFRSISGDVIDAASRLSEVDQQILIQEHAEAHGQVGAYALTMEEFIEQAKSRYDAHIRSQMSTAYLKYLYEIKNALTHWNENER